MTNGAAKAEGSVWRWLNAAVAAALLSSWYHAGRLYHASLVFKPTASAAYPLEDIAFASALGVILVLVHAKKRRWTFLAALCASVYVYGLARPKFDWFSSPSIVFLWGPTSMFTVVSECLGPSCVLAAGLSLLPGQLKMRGRLLAKDAKPAAAVGMALAFGAAACEVLATSGYGCEAVPSVRQVALFLGLLALVALGRVIERERRLAKRLRYKGPS